MTDHRTTPTPAEFVRRTELLDRLRAIVAELKPGGDGPDVALCIAADTIEEIERELRA
jgi:hypothetical protein